MASVDFTEHVIISAAGSAALAAAGAGWESSSAFGLMGVFVDLDHFPDYWRENGLNANIPKFFDYFSKHRAKKLVVALHAWEWIAVSLGGILFFGAPAWVLWGLLGWLCHLILDQRFNYQNRLAYFFVFRMSRRFQAGPYHG
jgi:hypothetical protein